MENKVTNTEEYIRGIRDAIPLEIKNVLIDDTYRKVTKNALAKIDMFNEDLLDTVSLETLMVLVGLQKISEFYTALENDLVLSGKGRNVAEEIDKNLFSKLHSAFKKLHTSPRFIDELNDTALGDARVVEQISKNAMVELSKVLEEKKMQLLRISVITLYTIRGLENKTTNLTEEDQNIKDLYKFFNK